LARDVTVTPSESVSSHKSGAEYNSVLGAENDGLKFRKRGRQNFDSSSFEVPYGRFSRKPFIYYQSYMILSVNVCAVLVLKSSVFFPLGQGVLRYHNNCSMWVLF